MTVHAIMPYRADRNLGRALNDAMAGIPDGDWAALMDHDVMWTTPTWHPQLEELAAFAPKATFAVVTNRIASPWQRAPEVDIHNNDIAYHRAIGAKRAKDNRTLLDISQTKGFGGVVTLLSKDAWRDAGGYADGFYCVDHSLFYKLRALKRPIYLAEHVYVYHFRGSSSAKPPLPAPKVPNCPCRGIETTPRRRIALP